MAAELDRGERGAEPDPSEGRIRRSWRLTRTAWRLLRGDPTMLALAFLGALFAALAAVAIFRLVGLPQEGGPSGARLLLVGLLVAYPATFIGVFFNVALVSAAVAALEGRRLGVGEALRRAGAKLGRIAGWSLLTVGVGALISEIAERIPGGGALAERLLGAAWWMATIFVVPILVVEDARPLGAVKRSAALLRSRWAEAVGGNLVILAWVVFLVVPVCMILGAGVTLSATDPALGYALFAAGALALVVLLTLANAVREIFALALYRFATEGATSGFAVEDLERPFQPKRRQRRREIRRTAEARPLVERSTDEERRARAQAAGLDHGYRCSHCGEAFTLPQAVDYHVRRKHRGVEPPPFVVRF